jgi:beta-carotene/zeaxanthin 4-ketolase
VRSKFNFHRFEGAIVAVIIITTWLISLAFLLSIDLDRLSIAWLILAILGRTFVQTGLFILAHDAIHGCVYPSSSRVNRAIGILAVTLSHNHWLHHRDPATKKDPDFHRGNAPIWYFKFMWRYLLNFRQFVSQFVWFGVAMLLPYYLWDVPLTNFFLFWILPICLSSLQLFFFGTYLPHRSSNLPTEHNATTSNFPEIISFFTCYHFGYHWEHHEYPHLPWYRLPVARRDRLALDRQILEL